MAWSDSAQDDSWPVGAWTEARHRGGSLHIGANFCFCFCVLIPPLLREVAGECQGTKKKLPCGFWSRYFSALETKGRVLGHSAALQGSISDFPVSTASQLCSWEKGKCPPLLLQTISTTPNMNPLKPPQPGNGYPHRVRTHGGRKIISERGHSRGES